MGQAELSYPILSSKLGTFFLCHVSTDTDMYKIEVIGALGLIRHQPGGVDPT